MLSEHLTGAAPRGLIVKLRSALLAGTAFLHAGIWAASSGAALMSALTLAVVPALADGGDGGGPGGGAGGSGFTGNPGVSGNTLSGGGGGGAGGGAGGTGGGPDAGASGPGGTSVASPDGGNGGDGGGPTGGGGGGGGGGFNGNGAGAASIVNGAPLLGGTGGNGGAGSASPTGGSGGGGGAGGYGAVVTGGGASSNTSSISGGAGGNGGGIGVGGAGGNGGDGGVGVQFTAAGAIFTNAGTVAGGNGGIAGSGTPPGAAGLGGAGIVGSGLTVINSGNITGGLSGDGVTRANAITFTGGTNILELQAGSAITGNVIAFSTADTLRLGGTANASFDVSQIGASAQYQGFGNFQKTGTSTWTLTGTTTAVTPWTINQGTLTVSADGNLGANTGALTFNGGTLQFGASFNLATTRAITLNAGGGTIDTNGFDTTISQVIGGAGGLTKIGNGTLTLDGLNTYGGATNINGGVLTTFGQAIPAGSAVSIANAAILNMESDLIIGSLAGAGIVRAGLASPVTLTTGGDNTSTTFSGAIADNGANKFSLVKTGTGAFTLSGTSTYTGTTTVNAGTLIVNGSIATSATTVNTGGTIGGTGTVGNTTINGGSLAPGNSIGTLTINGNLVLTSAAAYIVEVSPTQADRTNVTGTATLAGTVQAVFGPGSYIARTYTILSAAGGRSGTFGSLTTSGLPAGFAASLSYTGTDAILNLAAVLGQQPTTPGQQPLPNGGLNQNQFNVATTLNGFFNNGGTLPAELPQRVRAHRQQSHQRTHAALRRARDRRATGRVQADGPVSCADARSVRGRQEWRRRSGWTGARLCARPSGDAGGDRARLFQGDEDARLQVGARHHLRAALDRLGRGLRRLQQDQRRSHGGRLA